MKIGGLQTRTHTLYYSYQRKDKTMTTVYVLTLATDYEGECLLGVYSSAEQAEDASSAYLEECDREIRHSEQFRIRRISVGAPAELYF